MPSRPGDEAAGAARLAAITSASVTSAALAAAAAAGGMVRTEPAATWACRDPAVTPQAANGGAQAGSRRKVSA